MPFFDAKIFDSGVLSLIWLRTPYADELITEVTPPDCA